MLYLKKLLILGDLMSYQGELALENDVIKQLESQGYERIILRNHEQLVENFRQILNERNKENLKIDHFLIPSLHA